MDFMTIIGLIAGAATVYYVMLDGNILQMMFNPVAFILVFGGTVSSTFISYPSEILKHVFPSLKFMFIKRKDPDKDRNDLIDTLTRYSEQGRRVSIQSLTNEIATVNDKFLGYGLQMLVDGLDYEIIKDNMEKEMFLERQYHNKVAGVFRTMATLAPIFGLLGTLIGVVQVLRNLSDPSSMGEAMAIAITTTFYGIFGANFLFLPAAIKLNERSENELLNRQIVIEGILSVHKGELPSITRKKLNAFLISHLQTGETEGKKKAA
jgi:chemotaxis protein MotA